MVNHTFAVGNRYQNDKGPYEVRTIEGERMRIRYDGGSE